MTLNCDERGYVATASTVRVGSFGSGIVVSGAAESSDRRLFVAVRAEPSVTYIDARLDGPEISFRCQAAGTQEPNPLCDESHKVRTGTDALGTFNLPEEPYSLALDERLGVLYATHGIHGISLIDACAPDKPTLVSVTWPAFAQEMCTIRDPFRCQAVNALVLGEPGNPAGPLYALGRYLGPQAAEVQTLFLRGADQPCGGSAARPLELVPGPSFFPSAFFPNGMDIRGFAVVPGDPRAYVLYRNGRDPRGVDYSRDNPPALVAIDRSPDAQGRPLNRTVDVMEVCSGATELHRHDAGRGPRLYVVCFESGQVYVLDPELMEVSAVVNVGRGPATLGFSPRDPTIAYLAGFSDNNISVIDLKPIRRTPRAPSRTGTSSSPRSKPGSRRCRDELRALTVARVRAGFASWKPATLSRGWLFSRARLSQCQRFAPPPRWPALQARFHVLHPGETRFTCCYPVKHMDPRDEGIVVGLLVGEGHFGGDGRQPQVTLRMHVRHEALMRWLVARFPRSKLYGPYHHGNRHYFQWMARGEALVLDLLPILERHVTPSLDGHAFERLTAMTDDYADAIAKLRARAAL